MKKTFTFFAAMMLLVSSASAATIYCKVDKSWWTKDGAAVAIHAWNDTEINAAFPGDRMTPVEGVENLWMFELEDKFDKCVFSRVNGNGDLAYWGAKTEDQVLPTEGNNLFTLLKDEECWDEKSCLCHGEWSKYEAAPEIEGDLVYLAVNLPTENRPADDQIEVVGTFQFNNGAIGLKKLDSGWFIYNNPEANDFPLFYAAADDTFKFRDKSNNNKVLCELVDDQWVQAIFKFGDDWSKEEGGYKGSDPCWWYENDLSDAAQYAWKEGMPEPDPEEEGLINTVAAQKAVKRIVNGQLFIVRDGKMFNATGAQVK